MEKLRIGVIGLGFIGQLHVRIWSENPEVKLIGVADVVEKVAKETGGCYQCDFYTDYQDLLNRGDLDAVDICVPEDFHMAPALAAAKEKKHILIEKPIAKTVEEAMTIKKAAQDNGVRLMVAHVLKFDPRYVQLNDAIENGKIGTVTSLALKRTNSRGTPLRLRGKVSYFYYMGIHDLEMMLTYNKGAKPVRVYAQESCIVNKGLDKDAAFVTVTFDNGSVGSLELNWAFPENGACGFMTGAEVVGTQGAAILNVDNQGLAVFTGQTVEYPDVLHWPEYNGNIMGDLKEELAHFANATITGKPYLVDTDNAIAAVALVEAAVESIETGRVVNLEE